jgi:hypothetical protein
MMPSSNILNKLIKELSDVVANGAFSPMPASPPILDLPRTALVLEYYFTR